MPSENRQVWTTRLITLFFGVLQIAIGIWASTFNKSVIDNALTIAGFSSGILLGLFALGTFTKRTNESAAIWSALIGLLVMLAVQFALPLVPVWGFKLAFPWLPVIGSITTFSTGVLITACTERKVA